MLNIEIIPFVKSHVEDALSLFNQSYEKERLFVSILPPSQDYSSIIRSKLEKLAEIGLGFSAYHQRQLIGYIAGVPVSDFFGTQPGIFVPNFGHAVNAEYQNQVVIKLYEKAASFWVSKGLTSHAISLFTHDANLLQTWFWLGFGLRCVDALRPTQTHSQQNSIYTIQKADNHHLETLKDLHHDHHLYYRSAPMFMLNEEENALEDLQNWIAAENHHLFVASNQKGETVGYMRIEPYGESIQSRHPSMMNITGAFVRTDERGKGCAKALLNAILEWLREHGYLLCGVDYESINPMAMEFWGRHFSAYAYSLTRRIDERVTKFLTPDKRD